MSICYTRIIRTPHTLFGSYTNTMAIKLKADNEHPIPDRISVEKAPSSMEELEVAENTAKYLAENSQPIDIKPEDMQKAQNLFKDFNKQVSPDTLKQPAVILALSNYVHEYSSAIVSDAVETRNLIHNRLLQISGCGNPRYELKALELLGKMSDVGAFTEKSEITVTHKSSETLQGLIKEKITRLIDLDVEDVVEITDSLDEELKKLEESDGDSSADESGSEETSEEAA